MRRAFPSMEGRTIVRPDDSARRCWPPRRPAFNGGPDNCPARPGWAYTMVPPSALLQWRAGQLSGQTWRSSAEFDSRLGTLQWRAGQLSGQTAPHPPARYLCVVPSMEGRTIVRPDVRTGALRVGQDGRLQWRAGQLSGQTLGNRRR